MAGLSSNNDGKSKKYDKERGGIKNYLVESFSWKVYTDDIAVKRMDKSCFVHRGTGIPIEIRLFFKVDDLTEANIKKVCLIHNDIKYKARIEIDSSKHLRTRMFWHNDLSLVINETLEEWLEAFSQNEVGKDDGPDLRFERLLTEKDTYSIQFINPKIIEIDIEIQNIDGKARSNGAKEGKAKYGNSKSYERNLTNRREAIRIHGTKCSVCGFDFEKVYGKRGIGFIEVHHVTPLSELSSEIIVNPATDLMPVCSNCHRMIHRERKHVLSIGKLKKMIDEINKCNEQ
jgi:5-methylcytosine-specific restriction protein A